MVKNIITILMVYNRIIKKFPLKINKSIFPPGRSEIIHNKKNKVIIMIMHIQKMHTRIY